MLKFIAMKQNTVYIIIQYNLIKVRFVSHSALRSSCKNSLQ